MPAFNGRFDMKMASLFCGCPLFRKEQVRLTVGQLKDVPDVVAVEAHTVNLVSELFREAHLHGDDGSKGRTCIAEVIERRIVMPFIPEL